MTRILFSWLGRTDLRAVNDSDQVGIGPIAQAVQTRRFARLELLCDCPFDAAETYIDWLSRQSETRIIPHPGTLFLDEIGELPKPAQVRFLRALQEGEVTRVGATEAIQVDVRIIVATNRSLSTEVSASRFVPSRPSSPASATQRP